MTLTFDIHIGSCTHFIKGKGSETAKCILNERIYKTKLFGANFMQIGS